MNEERPDYVNPLRFAMIGQFPGVANLVNSRDCQCSSHRVMNLRALPSRIATLLHAAISDSGAWIVTRPRCLESIPSCSHLERIRLVVK